MQGLRRLFKGDRWIPWSFVALFGVIVIANGTMMFFAFDSWTGLSTDDSYKRGLVYNESLAERDAQATELAEARAALQASLVELKRLDVLTERRRQRDHAARALRERIELDDLAILRHRREKGG